MHGTDNDEPSRHQWRSPLINSTDEWVSGVFGTTSGSSITSIGFTTSKGRSFGGPWGAGGGEPFSFFGLLLGFFGALEGWNLSGIGAWYTPSAIFTPGAVMFPRSLERSPAYGSQTNVWTWDDTPNTSGAAPRTFSPSQEN
jgi:hypothetical protein